MLTNISVYGRFHQKSFHSNEISDSSANLSHNKDEDHHRHKTQNIRFDPIPVKNGFIIDFKKIIYMCRHHSNPTIKVKLSSGETTSSSRIYQHSFVQNVPSHQRYPVISTDSNFNESKAFIKKRTAVDDIVSKNISIILNNLLKSYENSQLPNHNEGLNLNNLFF